MKRRHPEAFTTRWVGSSAFSLVDSKHKKWQMCVKTITLGEDTQIVNIHLFSFGEVFVLEWQMVECEKISEE